LIFWRGRSAILSKNLRQVWSTTQEYRSAFPIAQQLLSNVSHKWHKLTFRSVLLEKFLGSEKALLSSSKKMSIPLADRLSGRLVLPLMG